MQHSLFTLPTAVSSAAVGMPAETVILLDLNYTLVENSHEKIGRAGSYASKIRTETYRLWLIDLVKPFHVILCTVRGEQFSAQTLARIEALTGWRPQEAYFNPTPDTWQGHIVKARYLPVIIAAHPGAPLLAIESSRHTRGMFARHGIPAISQEQALASGLVFPSVPRPPRRK